MKYKRLSDRRFCALKYNIVLQGFIFSSHGFLVCCGITILFIIKVLSIVLFEGFKVVGVVVVQVRQNNRVGGCSSVGVVVGRVIRLLWID